MSIDETPDPGPRAESPEIRDPSHEKLRKNIAARLTRLVTSEEGLRAMVAAAVPKELIASTMEQVDATKSEAMALVGRELRTFLDHLDVGEELAKILTAVSFEVRMEVRFIPNEDGTLRANVRGGAKPKVKIEPRKKPWHRRTSEEDEAEPGRAAKAERADAADKADKASAEVELEAAARAGDDAIVEEGRPSGGTSTPDFRSSSPDLSDASLDGREALHAATFTQEEPEKRLRHRLGRRSLTNLAERVADATAMTIRAAAEVAADAAADVVNEARRGREEHDDLDDY